MNRLAKLSALLVLPVALGLPSAAVAKKKPKDPDEIVCKTERFVGSNISSRVCKTRMEWEDGTYNSKQQLDKRQLLPPALNTKNSG